MSCSRLEFEILRGTGTGKCEYIPQRLFLQFEYRMDLRNIRARNKKLVGAEDRQEPRPMINH